MPTKTSLLLTTTLSLLLYGAAISAAPAAVAAEPATAASPKAGEAKGKHSDPTGAIAQCKDGAYSHASHRSHACRRHGGVEKWLDGK